MIDYLIFFLFFFGLFFGSFLGVLVERLPRGEQVFKGRSHCDFCGHTLAIIDLLPFISWASLGGKCRYCKKKLSFFYPFVELTTGTIFAVVGYSILSHAIGSSSNFFSPWLILAYLLGLSSAFIVIFFADLRYHIIPDAVLFPTILLVFLAKVMEWHMTGVSLVNPLLAGLAASAIFLLIFLFSRGRGMGFGDVKLVFLLGLLLGIPLIIVALYAAFLTGALAGVILILGKKKRLGQTIAFGPFLILGTVIALVFGERLLSQWNKFIF